MIPRGDDRAVPHGTQRVNQLLESANSNLASVLTEVLDTSGRAIITSGRR